jgi:hypothetical protein
MPVVVINTIRKRVVGALFANRLDPYSATVGTRSATNSRYQSDDEITDAILQADAMVCQAIIETSGHPYLSLFLTPSGNLSNGAAIPPHIGSIAKILVDGTPSRQTTSLAELLEVRTNPLLYPAAAKWHFIESSYIYNTGTNAVVYYPNFTIGQQCQAHIAYEAAVFALSMGILAKDGANTPEVYGQYGNIGTAYLQMIRGQQETLPTIEQVEGQLAA